jgi:hypothetical protein
MLSLTVMLFAGGRMAKEIELRRPTAHAGASKSVPGGLIRQGSCAALGPHWI